MRKAAASPHAATTTALLILALIVLLLAPAAVEGFAPRILHQRHPSSSSSRSSIDNRRRWTSEAHVSISPATHPISTSRSTAATALASSRASSDGFGDARGRSEFMDQGRIELLCKAGPDGASLGDCPFCHYVQMVLRYKVGFYCASVGSIMRRGH
jgi:hypothetical protein